VIGGLVTMFTVSFFTGLAIMIGRCDRRASLRRMIMLFFKMNEALQEIRHKP